MFRFRWPRVRRFACWLIGVGILTGAATGVAAPGDGQPSISFRADVLPILTEHCYRCHGPDAETRESGLRLDERRAALSIADSGERAIVPGDLNASHLWDRINHADADMRMPPADVGASLSETQRAVIRQWILEGAEYQRHWAFEPPIAKPLPELPSDPQNTRRVDSMIDAWIAKRLRDEGLQWQERADRYTLIRRMSLDLTGLPPTVAQVERFVHDSHPAAVDQLVDRLLASPAFGERWARIWLDLARYADSAGYAQDPPRQIWRYRDWVIQALNAGMTYDRFTIDQLAGDLLPDPTDNQLIATAFHRNTMTNSEGGTDDEEFRSAAVVDRVNTTMQVWMGMTMGCAQCHTHKYDPLSQAEYYQFYAVFNNTADADRGDESPVLTEWTKDELDARRALEAEIADLEEQQQELQTLSAESPQADNAEVKSKLEAIAGSLKKTRKRLSEIRGVTTPIFRELPSDKRRTTYVHIRGNFMNRGEMVEPNVPAVFPPLPPGAPANRLGVAKWLVDAQNPLTARVAVNRIWEQLFGIGLVETSEDFGTQGARPSHPELLDQLALELIAMDWDVKSLLRQILTSHTYRQSSKVTPASREQDPRNRLLSHAPSYRLGAEMIRDQALAISGLLSHKMFGPSVRPPRPNLGLRAAFGASTDWKASQGEDRYRRGLYTSWRRTTPYPSMTTFDAPSREVCTIRRIRTNTPLQAFVTLNDPVFFEAARALAGRMIRERPKSLEDQLLLGFQLCVARTPKEDELGRLVGLFHEVRESYAADADAAHQLLGRDATDDLKTEEVVQRAALAVVANVLLNLDEVLSKK